VSLNKPGRNETAYVIYIQDLHSNDTWQGKDVTLPQILPPRISCMLYGIRI